MVLASYDPNSNEKKNVMRSHEMILKILFQRKHSADIIENLIKAGRFLGVDIRLNLEAYIGRISRRLTDDSVTADDSRDQPLFPLSPATRR